MALFNSEICEFMDGEWLVVDNEALELYERYLSDENINFEGINKKYKNRKESNEKHKRK